MNDWSTINKEENRKQINIDNIEIFSIMTYTTAIPTSTAKHKFLP